MLSSCGFGEMLGGTIGVVALPLDEGCGDSWAFLYSSTGYRTVAGQSAAERCGQSLGGLHNSQQNGDLRAPEQS